MTTDLTELTERLARLGDQIDEARSTWHDDRAPRMSSSIRPIPTRPRRTPGVLVACALVAAAIVGVIVVSRHGSDQHSVTAVTPQPSASDDATTPATTVATDDASPTTPATDPATALTTALATTTTADTAASPTTLSDLPAEGAGLYVDPPVLGDGWKVIRANAASDHSFDSESIGSGIVSTFIAGYDADRTHITDTITVEVSTSATVDQLRSSYGEITATAHTVDGAVVYDAGRYGIVWIAGDRVVDVNSRNQTLDLLAVADGLRIRPDGGYDATVLPAGFVQLAVVAEPPPSAGPSWLTEYSGPDTTDPTFPALRIVYAAHPSYPAEVRFANAWPYPQRPPYAVVAGGRRMVVMVNPRFDISVLWDQADGSQVSVDYVPPVGLSVVEQDANALRYAEAVQRSTDEQWAAMQSDADAGRAQLLQQPWVAEQLTEHGLTADPAYQENAGAFPVVHATSSDGTPQDCEFIDRTLATCYPESTVLPAGKVATAELIDDHYIRVVTTGSSDFVRVDGSSFGLPLALAGAGALKIVYVALSERTQPITGCVQIMKTNAVVASIPIDGLNTTGTCPDQP